VPATAFKLLRTTACLAAGTAAVALIVVAAFGSTVLASALALRGVTGAARRRAMARPTPLRTASRPHPAPRAETAA
jgi:hypothetical protein